MIWSNKNATSHDRFSPKGSVLRKGNGTPKISGKSRVGEILFHLARYDGPWKKLMLSLRKCVGYLSIYWDDNPPPSNMKKNAG